MMSNNTLVNDASVEHLVKLWAERYVPDLSTLSKDADSSTVLHLLEVASPTGRIQTVAKVQRYLEIYCDRAGIETSILFSYIPNVVNLSDAQRIAQYVGHVFHKTLEIYQQQSLASTSPEARAPSPFIGTANFKSDIFRWAMSAFQMPAVEQLANEVEPVIRELREQHILAIDQRALGFLSTHFHFITNLVLKRLTLPEQVLLTPYFKFVEEQVCIPWQRVCAAAARHQIGSPTMTLVEQLLPKSQEIATKVYSRATELYPTHRSRRGGLSDPGVAASAIRDLNMFQGYLWLSLLEGSMAAVEQELVPLCVMVFPSVAVSWELVRKMLKLLIDEILTRVTHEQKYLLLPYTHEMQHLFYNIEKSPHADESWVAKKRSYS